MIETERLILRPFIVNDAADVYEFLKEPIVHCFACMKVNSLEEATNAVLERAKDTEYYFAIVLKKMARLSVRLMLYLKPPHLMRKMPCLIPSVPVG